MTTKGRNAMKSSHIMLVLSACLLGFGSATLASTTSGTTHHSSQATKPKVSMSTARKTALAKVPGARVESEELEHEHGKLVYSFDLKVADKPGVEEVQVDANTGKVVSHKHETTEAERKEQAEEKAPTKAHS
jgi:hypothetical protein